MAVPHFPAGLLAAHCLPHSPKLGTSECLGDWPGLAEPDLAAVAWGAIFTIQHVPVRAGARIGRGWGVGRLSTGPSARHGSWSLALVSLWVWTVPVALRAGSRPSGLK